MPQSRRQQPQTQHAIRDNEAMQRRQLFAHEQIALGLHNKELQTPLNGDFQLSHIPGLGDVFVNGAGVDRINRRIEIRKCRHQDPQDLRSEPAGPLKKLHSPLSRHALVGEDKTNLVLMILKNPISSLGAGGGEDPEGVAKGEREILQRLLLVVDIEDGETLVVVGNVHGSDGEGAASVASANSSTNSQYFPSSVFTRIRPPHSETIR